MGKRLTLISPSEQKNLMHRPMTFGLRIKATPLEMVPITCPFKRAAITRVNMFQFFLMSSRYCPVNMGYALKNLVEGLSDEALYPWESPKINRLKSVKPTFATEQKKVLIHR